MGQQRYLEGKAMSAKEDIREQLEKMRTKPRDDYRDGIAMGLQIALQFIEYHELDKSIREFRKGVNSNE
jgi:hypothetical protein